jgi:hypothetical protein
MVSLLEDEQLDINVNTTEAIPKVTTARAEQMVFEAKNIAVQEYG